MRVARAAGILGSLGTGFIHADARASLIALLVALCAGGACSDEKAPAAARNILLITVDTLRADHLGIYGYERPTSPAIDRWFEDARIYESAYSTEANTSPSVVSILTGLPPQRHGVRFFFQKLSPEIRILPDYLRDHGYLTAAVVSNMVLTDEALGLADRFDHYDDFVDEASPGWKVYERRASRTTDAALAWLVERQPADHRHLLWVHYIDPHGPYAPPPDAPVDFTHDEPLRIDLKKLQRGHLVIGVGDDGREYLDRYDEEIAVRGPGDRAPARRLPRAGLRG